ncbi:MAG: peptide deformylase [Bacteroidota bacterium]|nr:peptide deformylase [Bacteroidota bacterium]
MVLPIVAYGSSILHKRCKDIQSDYLNLDILIENMFETMYNARGVGLAAPQINKDIRLFVVDTTPFFKEEEVDGTPIKKVFINANIIQEEGEGELFNEGCLSIPEIREDINRKSKITIEYLDEEFNKCKQDYDGVNARVLQHEYDHIEGILFTDKLSPLRKRVLKSKLVNISKGNIEVDYKMSFTKK